MDRATRQEVERAVREQIRAELRGNDLGTLVRQLQGEVKSRLAPVLGGVVNGDGSIAVGASSGWTVVRNGVGDYSITFSPALERTPIVVATAESWWPRINSGSPVTVDGFGLLVTTNGAAQSDQRFHFVAFLPR